MGFRRGTFERQICLFRGLYLRGEDCLQNPFKLSFSTPDSIREIRRPRKRKRTNRKKLPPNRANPPKITPKTLLKSQRTSLDGRVRWEAPAGFGNPPRLPALDRGMRPSGERDDEGGEQSQAKPHASERVCNNSGGLPSEGHNPRRGSPKKFASQRALRGSLRGLCGGSAGSLRGLCGVFPGALRGSEGVRGIFRVFSGAVTLCL